MLSTILVITLFLGLFGATTVLWALFLRIGLRWAKVQEVSIRRLALATCLNLIFQSIFAVVTNLISPTEPTSAIVFEVAVLIAAVLIPCGVIMWVFKTGFLSSLKAWISTFVTAAIVVPFLLFIFRPFVFEAFKASTNSMAPTLLGNHWRGTCVECGNPAFCTPIPEFPEPPLMICETNFHVTQPADYGDRVFSPDRFLVAKFLKPRRWDLIVFRYPEEPSILYVKRLVGLPGEEITIRDGYVWANGTMLTPPESIRGIKYLSKIDGFDEALWGAPERPAMLADDEYFALGDFSPQAKDSRVWNQGAPGHPPYAVPESYLRGVVTHIYWPPARWRTLR